MDPNATSSVQRDSESWGDPAGWDGGGTLLWVGGFSGLALIIAFVVTWSYWGRRRQTSFEEPHRTVVPMSHRAPPPGTAKEHASKGGSGSLLRRALSGSILQEGLRRLFGGASVDESAIDELEEALLRSDVSQKTAQWLLEPLRGGGGAESPDVSRGALRQRMVSSLKEVERTLSPPADLRPWVVLVVGVNGSGKTTTIGKLAARFVGEGRSVMVAAADTFRAAAVEQLKEWAARSGADVVAGEPGADPGSVVHDALQAALARGHDIVLIDTAGRLQTAKPLMEQLSKVRRVVDKVVPGGPHETIMVLDGTMGQNGLSQARQFHDATPLSGLVITKLDGTAKGGMVLTLAHELKVPVCLLGLGEGIDDLRDFEADAFVDALA